MAAGGARNAQGMVIAIFMVMFRSIDLNHAPFEQLPQSSINLIKSVTNARTFADDDNGDTALNHAWVACQHAQLHALRRKGPEKCALCPRIIPKEVAMMHLEAFHPLSDWIRSACCKLQYQTRKREGLHNIKPGRK